MLSFFSPPVSGHAADAPLFGENEQARGRADRSVAPVTVPVLFVPSKSAKFVSGCQSAKHAIEKSSLI